MWALRTYGIGRMVDSERRNEKLWVDQVSGLQFTYHKICMHIHAIVLHPKLFKYIWTMDACDTQLCGVVTTQMVTIIQIQSCLILNHPSLPRPVCVFPYLSLCSDFLGDLMAFIRTALSFIRTLQLCSSQRWRYSQFLYQIKHI